MPLLGSFLPGLFAGQSVILRSILVIALALAELHLLGAQPKQGLVVQSTPARRVEATLTFEVSYPDGEIAEWEFVFPRPRDLPGQRVARVVATPAGVELADLSQLRQPVINSLAKSKTAAEKHMMTASLRIEATLMARQLTPYVPGARRPAVPALADAESKGYTAATSQINFADKTFQKWLDQHKLRRNKQEPDVDFARRVFDAMRANFTYVSPYLHDGNAAAVCQTGQGDANGLSVVFVGALRANEIPARVLIGGLVKSEKPFEKIAYGVYCRAEFYAKNIGWVPVDLGYGVVDASVAGLNAFGNDAGDMLVLHFDSDLIVEMKAGKVTLPVLQVPYCVPFAVDQPGNRKTKEDWQVREFPLNPKKK
jgi:transglutaminase-like putative cysteine protease